MDPYQLVGRIARTVDPAPLRRLSSEWPLAGQSQKAPPRHEAAEHAGNDGVNQQTSGFAIWQFNIAMENGRSFTY